MKQMDNQKDSRTKVLVSKQLIQPNHQSSQRKENRTLYVQSLSMSLGSDRNKKTILHNISLDLPVGQVLGVLGPNGAGKTSLLHCLTGDVPHQYGQIIFDGQTITDLSSHALASMRAVLPQHHSLSFNMPVLAVVAMGAYPFVQATQADVNQWVAQAIQQVELEALQEKDYLALSGGEQQRVQFARVLVQAYAIIHQQGHVYIFLDEPTASLDPKHQALLMRVVSALAAAKLAAVFIVMHDLNLASRWCDRVLLLNQGHVAACDSPQYAFTPARLESIYGLPMTVMPHPHQDECVLVVSYV
jgi:iron complex transport system ATP-binding protein